MKKINNPAKLGPGYTKLDYHCLVNPRHTAEQMVDMIDFSEQRMLHLLEIEKNPRNKVFYESLITDYRNGRILVGWKRGELVYHRLPTQ